MGNLSAMKSIYFETAFCDMKLSAQNNAICGLDFFSSGDNKNLIVDKLLEKAIEQIAQYAESAEFQFDLPIAPQGTEYQKRVWAILQTIPAGQVKTYGEIAKMLDSSPRAVGNACRSNPVPLIIPCHRVVSISGLGGFAGKTQGLNVDLKRQLLAHEGVEI